MIGTLSFGWTRQFLLGCLPPPNPNMVEASLPLEATSDSPSPTWTRLPSSGGNFKRKIWSKSVTLRHRQAPSTRRTLRRPGSNAKLGLRIGSAQSRAPPKRTRRGSMHHGCCWETLFYILACCVLVGNPHFTAKQCVFAPLPDSNVNQGMRKASRFILQPLDPSRGAGRQTTKV